MIFNINIIKILIIHAAIDFSENHIKKDGWIIKMEWTHNGFLKYWHYICHANIMKSVNSKKCHSNVKIKIENTPQWNEEFKNKMHLKIII